MVVVGIPAGVAADNLAVAVAAGNPAEVALAAVADPQRCLP